MRPKPTVGTLSPGVVFRMHLVRAAILFAAFAFPAVAYAGGPTMDVREVPLHGARSLAVSQAPGRFDLVGLHWQGKGGVLFRTRDLGGRWSRWSAADADPQAGPDAGSAEARRTRGWTLGQPVWTGGSRGIQYRTSGHVTRLRAYFVRSPVERVPMRRVSLAGSPAIMPRSGWSADESIRRVPPVYASSIRLAVVHHTAGSNTYTAAQAPSIVRSIELYHVQGNGWNDIGYNFLVDKYGQVFEGRYGGITRNVVGAHAEGFNTGTTGISVLGNYNSVSITPAARDALVKLIAWRLDLAHIDPLSTLSFISGGNPRFPAGVPVFLRAISGHRDTGFTDCPGNTLYDQLPSIAQAVAASGAPKLYAPVVRGQPGGPVRFTARLSEELPWTVTVADTTGRVVGTGSGTGTAVDWTWDATLVGAGPFGWSIGAGLTVRPATGSFGNLPTTLTMTRVAASLAVFSPNGDGRDEQTTISYTLSVPAHVTASLTDVNGVALSTLFSDDKPAGKNSFVFRAEGLPDGGYQIVLSAQSPAGKTATASVPLVVNRTLAGYSVTPTLFSPNGDGRRDTIAFPFSLAYPVDAELRIVTKAGATVASVLAGVLAAGPQRLTWDGATAAGTRLPDGSYRAILSVTDPIGTVTQSVAFASDTTAPRISILSLRRLRFRVSEQATVTVLVNGRRIRKIEPRGAFHIPFRGVPRKVVFFALDVAGNRSPTLRYPAAP